MKKVLFPLRVQSQGVTWKFDNVKELHDFYYKAQPSFLVGFSRPFWDKGINLTELVHWPERYSISY